MFCLGSPAFMLPLALSSSLVFGLIKSLSCVNRSGSLLFLSEKKLSRSPSSFSVNNMELINVQMYITKLTPPLKGSVTTFHKLLVLLLSDSINTSAGLFSELFKSSMLVISIKKFSKKGMFSSLDCFDASGVAELIPGAGVLMSGAGVLMDGVVTLESDEGYVVVRTLTVTV